MVININTNFRDKFRIDIKNESKKPLISALASVLMMLVISIIIYIAVKFASDYDFSIVNPIHIMMSSVFGYIDINNVGVIDMFSGGIKIGLIILLPISAVSIAVSNVMIYKREMYSVTEVIRTSIKISLFFAVMMSLLAVFSKTRTEIMGDGMMAPGAAILKFTMTSVFFNSFVISFITLFLTNWKRSFIGENYYTDIIMETLSHFIKIFGVFMIATIVMVFVSSSVSYQISIPGYPKAVSVLQMIIYLIVVASGGSVSMANSSISLFKIVDGATPLDIRLLILMAASLSAVIMIIKGADLYEGYRMEGKRAVISFSVIYGMIVSGIGSMASIYMNTAQNGISLFGITDTIIYNVNPLSTLVITGLITFALLELGYHLKPIIDDIWNG